MKNQYLILICFLFLSSTIYSQEIKNETNEIRKNAISFNIAGTTPIIGITYERIVSDKISLEIGLGIPGIGVGMKVFPFGIREGKLMFHTGITATYVKSKDIWSGKDVTGVIAYLPLGMSYFGKYGFNFGIDVGPAAGMYDETKFGPYGNLKVGYRF
jgi:hypothetical protein